MVVESPLPGGVAAVVRFFLSLPQWFQIGGAVVGALLAVIVLAWLWSRRRAIWQWIVTRERRLQWTLAAALLVVLAGAVAAGTVSWNYVQHDNGFCTGCHVMKPAFQEFVAREDKHDILHCHDCHQQSVFASMRQLYLWVAERPTAIGPHAKVANAVCERCHVTGERETWQRIASTAGHRVHLESDSAFMQNLQCVTCHGETVHRFVPAKQTCGQSNCHEESATRIVLGRMAGQTAVHCVACHRFTADVPALATTDSARGTLVPAQQQCLGCHEMRAVLADFDAARDPHGGTCGTCHNPHEQTVPEAAVRSCGSGQCHAADWRQEPFHQGAAHRRITRQCLTCHEPHRARVDASDCEGCHRSVRERTRLRPPLPFDTARALRPISLLPGPPREDHLPKSGEEWGEWGQPVEEGQGGGLTPAGDDSSAGGFVTAAAAGTQNPDPRIGNPTTQDSFPHARHRTFACLECHTTGAGRGRLTFEAPRGCQICHHQARRASRCEACHQPGELAALPARESGLPFPHAIHEAFRCVDCHTTPVTLAPPSEIVRCQLCHAQHHEAARACAACHRSETLRTDHAALGLEAAHQQCDACHARETISLLVPTRSFCQTCHQPQRTGHHVARECTVCHFLVDPKVYQPRLLTPPGP